MYTFSEQEAFLQFFEQVTGIRLGREKSFKTLVNPKTGARLRFDGYSEQCHLLVEYDDRSHFEEIPNFKTTLDERRERDFIKSEWARGHGFTLIRFPYFQSWTSYNILSKFPKDFKFPKFNRE